MPKITPSCYKSRNSQPEYRYCFGKGKTQITAMKNKTKSERFGEKLIAL
jgi:hypothetical protein